MRLLLSAIGGHKAEMMWSALEGKRRKRPQAAERLGQPICAQHGFVLAANSPDQVMTCESAAALGCATPLA